MFEALKPAPADAILGLKEEFDADSRTDKVNLVVGVYKNSTGKTPILECVKQAETELLESEKTKSYLNIAGISELGNCIQELLFGADHEIISSGRALTAQTPGGTGALRVAGDFIKRVMPDAKIWISDPTWANHKNIFNAAGVEICTYPYYNSQTKSLDFDAMLNALKEIPSTDVVLLHACCHNPTGCDPTPDQWNKIAEVSKQQNFLPFFDFAYQGFGNGLDEDAAGLRTFATEGCQLLIANSFSKNFSMYNERIGSLTVVDTSAEAAGNAYGHIKSCIRANYSNPPAHGGAVAAKVLSTPELKKLWSNEVSDMRNRITEMRNKFCTKLTAMETAQDFGFMETQRGMFSYTGLSPEQVEKLREKHGIYIVKSGRINVVGLTENNIDHVCKAIADVAQDQS